MSSVGFLKHNKPSSGLDSLGFKNSMLRSPVQSNNIGLKSVATIHESNTIKQATWNPLQFFSIIWDFSRPHTLIGTFLSIVTLFAFATPPSLWFTQKFASSLFFSLFLALLMNVYITGLNQITDVEIDKINKPYLPIASGQLSKQTAIFIVLSSLLASLSIGYFGEFPLRMTLLGSAVLGTVYSLPPFRVKRFPFFAALCILVVRGSLVNLGFFLQVKRFHQTYVVIFVPIFFVSFC